MGDLAAHGARGILSALEKQGNYLIICTRPEVRLPAEFRRVELQAPDILAHFLLEIHLEHYGILDVEKRRRIMETAEVEAVLENPLLPSQIDQLAQILAEGDRLGKTVQEAMPGFEAMADSEVEAWFSEVAHDVNEATFRIALAIFSGVPYTAIRKAGEALRDLLQGEPRKKQEDVKEAEPALSPFLAARTQARVIAAGGQRVKRIIPTEYSEAATIEVIELKNKRYTLALLRYLWDEFDEVRGPLLEWLCEYAVEANQDMRMRASGAIGALAAFDFHQIAHTVFRHWSDVDLTDSHQRRRRFHALGAAMGVLVWDESRTDDARGLLNAWVEKGGVSQRWAAARAFAQVGLRYPREAIRQWRRILESEDRVELWLTERLRLAVPHPLQMSVVDAVITLFAMAVEFPHSLRPVYEEAIEGLAAWVEEDVANKRSQQAGLPLFLTLTSIGMPPDDGSGDPKTWPPAMLYVAGTQPDSSYRRALAGLMRRAIRTKELRRHGLEVLRRWIGFADEEPWLEDVLELLLSEILHLPETSSREQEILSLNLNRWARHPVKPSRSAMRLLINLTPKNILT